ncbi:A/G-specific adenine glycosylase [Agrococcus sp. Marseille-Q4369]|uniref:A/G-specific adenine glycosylase n=1 Tax=Agrococcus sp. Marseille-Q4369 TaxID=2810513 RepID=UPI001B8CEC48|nr:A/G-specific adenine glycosylase [Agrococcus sp. Marseille-Q4369]QUW19595.1 A/G-specific adenine glycosylase [Agrococcus sp. Marseille-Q4369]
MLGDPSSAALADWYRSSARDLPWRRPDFDAWGTLVSEVMLQQTQAARVAVEIDRWLARWPTPADLADAPTHEVLRQWGTLGYPRRALRLQDTARAIVERHGGEVPRDVASLLALPGVGDYTARAVAVFHFGDRHPVVDTNVRRVVARAVHGRGEAGSAARRDLADVDALLPEAPADASVVSIALMELGALVCTARAPRCPECPIADACAWRAAGYPPFEGRRAPRQPRFEGSDRQARGTVLRALRAVDVPLSPAELHARWHDADQLERAIASLAADGLVVREGDAVRLPD